MMLNANALIMLEEIINPLKNSSKQVVGTAGYAAPEYMLTGRLTSKSDIWSYGVVLYELITGRQPMDRNRPKSEQKLLEWVKPYITDSKKFEKIIDPTIAGHCSVKSAMKLAAIANKCLVRQPKSRPKMSEVLEMVQRIVENAETGSPHNPPRNDMSEELNSEETKKKGVHLKRTVNSKMGEGKRLAWWGWTTKLIRTNS